MKNKTSSVIHLLHAETFCNFGCEYKNANLTSLILLWLLQDYITLNMTIREEKKLLHEQIVVVNILNPTVASRR